MDLDFSSDMQDSHFARRYLNPMPGSTPTQIIIMDDTGTSTGFAAGLAVYLAANVKAPNRANMVYYLRGGVDALRKECPWMFKVPRIKAILPSANNEDSSVSSPSSDIGNIDDADDAFVGWGDEPVEHSPTTSNPITSAESNTDDLGTTSVVSPTEDSMEVDGDDDEEQIDETMVDSGIGGIEDDSVEMASASLSDDAAFLLKSPTASPHKKKITSNKVKGHLIHHPNNRHHISHHPIIKSISKHPQAQFPHLPKTNSPTHDLRNLQHHLVAAVWYGKRVPAGDVAVPISHVVSPTKSLAAKSPPPTTTTHYNSVTQFLHLSSCYAAADASELRSKNIRHIVRLGWGFDAFNNGLHNQHHTTLGTGIFEDNASFDEADWSEWEDSHDDVTDDAAGNSSGSNTSGPMSGVEGSVKFFQGLAGGMGTVSELGKMVENIRRGRADGGGMNGFVLEDREERKKLRGLMGGVAKRVGPPPAMGVNGSQAREAKKRTTWRVKMYDFPIEDTPAAPIRWIFEKCCEVVEAARLLGENVLIHCHAGVSRSSTIILAYLMRFQKLTLYEAWLLTYKARPIIRPNEGFARALQELEREIHPHLTEPTLPIFWMCDSYANFMELLELRERANRAGLLKPIDASSPTSASGIPASVTSDECRCGNHCKLCECGLRCECQCGASRLSQLPGPVGGMVGASIIDSGAAVEETEPFPPVRKGRSRGLSFGGRAG